MVKSIVIELKIEHMANLVRGEEKDSWLNVWIAGTGEKNTQLTKIASGGTPQTSTKLRFDLGTDPIFPSDTAICIRQYTSGLSNFLESKGGLDESVVREWGIQEAGCTIIPLKSLYTEKTHKSELIVWNAFDGRNHDEVKKGVVHVECDFLGSLIGFGKPSIFTINVTNAPFITDNIIKYTEICAREFQDHGTQFSAIANLHGPPYMYNGLVNYFQAFVNQRFEESSEGFWQNLADAALMRHYARANTLEEANRIFSRATDQEVLTIACTMCRLTTDFAIYMSDAIPVNKDVKYVPTTAHKICNGYPGKMLAVNYPYFADKIDKNRSGIFYNSFESFNDMRARLFSNSGLPPGVDCEDVGREIAKLLEEVQFKKDFRDPRLMRMHDVLKEHIVFFSLAGVGGAQLKDADDPNAKLGGHAFVLVIPTIQFMEMHGRTNEVGSPFGTYMPRDLKTRPQVIEGTGPLCPDGTDQDRIRATAIARELIMRNKKVLYHIKNQRTIDRSISNPFYRVFQEGVSPTIFRGIGGNEELGARTNYYGAYDTKTNTFGLKFEDLMNNNSSNLGLWCMQPLSNEQLDLSFHLLEYTEPIAAYREPRPELRVASKANHRILESLVNYVRSKKRVSSSTTPIQFLPRADQLTSEFESNWKEMIDKEEKIENITYINSTFAPDMEMYQMTVHYAIE
jgi:hypothetical protein